MMPTAKTADLANGLRLPYLERGESDGIPVLLLHGYSDSARSYLPLLAHLPRTVRAIALTQRGHGDAARPGAGYRIADFAADLAQFMAALALPSAVIVGHSMGSQVAQRFAIDHPAQVRGLALIGAFTTLRGNPEIAELWKVVADMRDPVDPEFVREFQRSTLARPVADDFFEMIVTESLKLPARVWCDALAGQLQHDLAPELAGVTAPTLVLWGDRDTIGPGAGPRAPHSAIRHARFITHRGAGHAPHWEDPATIAADLAAFVSSLERARPPRRAARRQAR